MRSKTEVSRETLERWAYDMRLVSPIGPELREILAAPVVERQPVSIPRISGLGRDADHPKALVLYLSNVPTDDDIRAIQEAFRAPPEFAELQATIARLTAENERLKKELNK